MTDFKGRKDFPEVADDKIKIGDYSGWNRLSVVDIYSPKAEPELRDRMMEPIKGKTNNYDSPILSQQPVIVLSDDKSEEAILIKAIDGYMGKDDTIFVDKKPAPKKSKSMDVSLVSPMPKPAGKGGKSRLDKDHSMEHVKEETVSSLSDNSMSDLEPREKPKSKKSKFGQRAYVAQQEARRQQAGPADSYAKAETIEKKGRKKTDVIDPNLAGTGIIPAGSKFVGTGLGLKGQEAAKKLAGPVISFKPGDPGHAEKLAETEAQTANRQQGHTERRPLVAPIDKAHVKGIGKQWEAEEHEREAGANIDAAAKKRAKLPLASRRLPTSEEGLTEFTRRIGRQEKIGARGGRNIRPDEYDSDESMFNAADTHESRLKKSTDLEEGFRSWFYQG